MVGTDCVSFRMWPLTTQRRACGHRACYVAVPLYVCGFVVLGVALKEHNSIAALVIGWGLLVAAVMMNTVAVCASSLYVRTTREDSSLIFFGPRCLHQRLLPEISGRDQRLAEPRACAGWFQRCVLSSPMGDQTRSVTNARLRGSVSHLPSSQVV
jgi:hypothetical protein